MRKIGGVHGDLISLLAPSFANARTATKCVETAESASDHCAHHTTLPIASSGEQNINFQSIKSFLHSLLNGHQNYKPGGICSDSGIFITLK